MTKNILDDFWNIWVTGKKPCKGCSARTMHIDDELLECFTDVDSARDYIG